MIRRIAMVSACAASMMAAGTATADTDVQALKDRIAQLEARLDSMATAEDNWLTERRAEDIRSLVDEVIADAQNRPTLVEGGMQAGHDGRNFVLKGGNAEMRIFGQIQVRRVYSFRSNEFGDDPDTAKTQSGSEIRRMRLGFQGSLDLGHQFDYRFVLDSDRETNNISLLEAVVSTKLFDFLTLYTGRTKGPFAKEELVISSRQMAVDRSFATQQFTTKFHEGLGFKIDIPDMEMLRLDVMFSDGARSGNIGGNNDFSNTQSDFAVTARAEVKVLGEKWNNSDFTSKAGDEASLALGAAVHYQSSKTGTTANNDNAFLWTVDALFKADGFSAFGAFYGAHLSLDGRDDVNAYAFVAQGAYSFDFEGYAIEPFVRFDWTYGEAPGYDNGPDANQLWTSFGQGHQQFLTFGGNYYIKGHSAKITVDAVYGFNATDGDRGIGLRAANTGAWTIRSQFQLLF